MSASSTVGLSSKLYCALWMFTVSQAIIFIITITIPRSYIHNTCIQAKTITCLFFPVITSSYCTAGLHNPKSPATFHTSSQHSLPLSRSQNSLTNSPGMWKTSRLCVWVCEPHGEKGLPFLALRFCCTSTGLSGMSTCAYNNPAVTSSVRL